MTTRKNRTVLLVDDDESILSLLQIALTQLGWQVLAAANGQQALDLHEAQIPALDLLITDLQMPLMNGCELARRLREMRPTLPILFISGDSSSDLLPAVEK